MIPRYVIINPKVRTKFEKKNQLPYGYSNCKIFTSERKAINFFKGLNDSDNFIIEKVDSSGKMEYYKN